MSRIQSHQIPSIQNNSIAFFEGLGDSGTLSLTLNYKDGEPSTMEAHHVYYDEAIEDWVGEEINIHELQEGIGDDFKFYGIKDHSGVTLRQLECEFVQRLTIK